MATPVPVLPAQLAKTELVSAVLSTTDKKRL
jgi:hypothetical protein